MKVNASFYSQICEEKHSKKYSGGIAIKYIKSKKNTFLDTYLGALPQFRSYQYSSLN